MSAVLLHGTAGSRRQWTDLVYQLPKDLESVALDLPGYTAQEVPAARRSLSDEALMIMRRLCDFDGPVHLIGHSYGAALALRVAVKWPGMIASLTLFEPAIFHLLRDGHAIEQQMHADIAEIVTALDDAAADGEPERGVARFIDFWNGPGSFERYPAESRLKLIQRMGLIRANFAALEAETWKLEDCARVTCPVLGLYGENSPLLAQHLTRLVAGQMANAKVLPVSGAGHFLPMTHAATVAKFLTAHLGAAEKQMVRLPPRAA